MEGRFCRSCRENAPACASCGAPTRSGIPRDGRVLCPDCDRRRVEGKDTYQAVYDRVLVRLRETLGLTLREAPPLRVESASTIESHPGLPEHRERLSGLYVRDEKGNASIHVLSHLTEDRLTAVLAHELAHAWQAENCPEEQSARVREGFAEWVAWHVVGGADARADNERDVIQRRTDEYGLGFRLFAHLEATRGAAFALWWATVARNGAG